MVRESCVWCVEHGFIRCGRCSRWVHELAATGDAVGEPLCNLCSGGKINRAEASFQWPPRFSVPKGSFAAALKGERLPWEKE